MEKSLYVEVKLVEGVEGIHEEKMLEMLNDGFEVLGMTTVLHGATRHHILMAKKVTATETPKPTKMTKSKKSTKV